MTGQEKGELLIQMTS